MHRPSPQPFLTLPTPSYSAFLLLICLFALSLTQGCYIGLAPRASVKQRQPVSEHALDALE